MRGGYRTGAGRKQGFAAKQAEEARQHLSERVAQEIGSIGDALISKAKEGNIPAIKELLDRAWGRAPQAMEISGNKGMPIPILGVEIRARDNSNATYRGLSANTEQVEK